MLIVIVVLSLTTSETPNGLFNLYAQQESTSIDVILELSFFFGMLSPLFIKAICFSIIGIIPFLFFRKTRSWKTFIYLFFIFFGYFIGSLCIGATYRECRMQRGFNHPTARWICLPTFFLISVLIACYPLFLFKILKHIILKIAILFVLLLFIYLWFLGGYLLPCKVASLLIGQII